MKKLFKIAMIAIAAMASFSCAKEITPKIEDEIEEVVVKDGFKLYADVDSDLTKTVLSGTSILWGENDAVKAFGDNVYTSTNIERTNGNKTAEFTFGPLEDGDDVLYALYPADNAGGTDYDNMTITIPSEQVATADSFDPAAMAAIGEIDGDYKIAFKNIGALLSIVIKNDDIASVELSATEESGDSMTGTAAVEMDGAGNITTVTDGSSTRVKLTGGLNNGETYYFVVYPGTYSNLRIVVTDTDGAIAVYRNKTPFTVARNENWKIAELTIPAGKWVPATVEYRYFYESFDTNDSGSGGNDGVWSGSGTANRTFYSDNDGWEGTSKNGADHCVKSKGALTTPAFSGIGIGSKNVTLRFKAATWGTDDTTLTLSISGGGTLGATSKTMGSGSWAELSTTITGATSSTKVTFTPANRMFLDEVEVVGEVVRDDSPRNYTVTYNANTGAGDAPIDGTTYNDQTNFVVTVLGQGSLTKVGHNFNGWNTAADGSGTAYAAGAKFVISANMTLYAQWTPIDYAITANENAHGTYIVQIGGVNATTGQYNQNLSIATSSIEAGYSFNKFVVSYTDSESIPHSADLTTNPAAYTMPAYPISISMVLNAVTTYTISLYSNGLKVKDVVISENAYLLTELDGEEDALTGPAGKVFLGWSTSSNPASITYITASTKATANVNLYAVFGKAATYNLVESSLGTAWAGDYLIAYSSSVFADGRVGGTSGLGANGSSVDPGTNLSGKIVDGTWGDTYNVTLEEITSGSNTYLLKTKDGKYNYQTSNANGLPSSSSRETATGHPLTITFTSSSDISIAVSAGAVFHYNSGDSGYFRFYKNGGQNPVYLYKRQAGEELLTW